MKVKEFIEKLQTYNEDLNVLVYFGKEWDAVPVKGTFVDTWWNKGEEKSQIAILIKDNGYFEK